MALTEKDELRHVFSDDPNWRESIYFNFADPKNGLGGWIYLWVVPNKEKKSGMLVSVYKGIHDRFDINGLAFAQPHHMYFENKHKWVYCYKQEVAELLDQDFDDAYLCGLRLQRETPLRSYKILFDDSEGASLDLQGQFTTLPYDYSTGVYSTPWWVATNRYHRSWRAKGTLSTDAGTFQIDTTGDSDHSWGIRDMSEFSRHTFKMWSFQSQDGSRSVSVIEQSDGVFLGFIDIDGDMQSVAKIKHRTEFTRTGLQRRISLRITDRANRVVSAKLENLFSAIGHGEPSGLWGFEGVGEYDVEEWGPCTGVASYFWPPTVSPDSLQALTNEQI